MIIESFFLLLILLILVTGRNVMSLSSFVGWMEDLKLKTCSIGGDYIFMSAREFCAHTNKKGKIFFGEVVAIR